MRIISQRVAPRASAASFWSAGTVMITSREIAETIAITLVIGNAPDIGHTIFSQGYSLAAVIANEFGEAANNPTHRAALIAAGLVLFVLTLVINAAARYFVVRGSRGNRIGTSDAASASAAAGLGG